MKKLLRFAFCFYSFVLGAQVYAYSGYRVISDIDDTIKITNVSSPLKAAYNGLIRKKVFSGMKELYEEIAKNKVSWSYVSGSPQMLLSNFFWFLFESNGFPNGDIWLQNWWKFESTAQFKMRTIRQIASESDLPLVMIGDDTQKDPEVYDWVSRQFPSDRVLKIYIHIVKGREIPRNINGYFTAFDIALDEVEDGRIDTAQARRVGEAILYKYKPKYLFPSFVQNCPVDYEHRLGPIGLSDQELVRLVDSFQEYVRNYCKYIFSYRAQ